MEPHDEEEPFICPLSLNLMEDPVIDPEDNSYERSAVEIWMRVVGTSQLTRKPLVKLCFQLIKINSQLVNLILLIST